MEFTFLLRSTVPRWLPAAVSGESSRKPEAEERWVEKRVFSEKVGEASMTIDNKTPVGKWQRGRKTDPANSQC